MKEIRGMHLIVDGYVKDSATLEPEAIVELFDSLVEELDMQYLQRPLALRVPLRKERLSGGEDEGGWSVICQITTSHIALHGWPLRRAFMMDVFSCKDFDMGRAKDLVFEKLQVEKAVVQSVERRGPLVD
jgi:S-adenosylmethionine decarboxylase